MKKATKTFALGLLAAATLTIVPQPASAATARLAGSRTGGPAPAGDLAFCPAGYHLSPFESPIYDADGRFVVGYETIWFCIPDDLRPAG